MQRGQSIYDRKLWFEMMFWKMAARIHGYDHDHMIMMINDYVGW